jgi:dimethylargininase
VHARLALVRPPGDSFARALSNHPDASSIDPERARAQHEAYRRTLESLGLEVTVLPVDEENPDSCFVQDLAIVVNGRTLLCRPGAESRRPEVAGIEDAVRAVAGPVKRVEDPATLEGGDVLRVGDTLIVGSSERTNEAGIEALERFAAPDAKVVRAEVREPFLHLLSGMSAVEGAVVGASALIDQQAFDGLERLPVPDEEAAGCNFVALGDDVVMAAGYPSIRKELEGRGLSVHEVDLSEFAKADGGPTCLSLLV